MTGFTGGGMTAQTVHFKVSLTVHENKLAAFEQTAKAMTAGTSKEPGALGYEWYLSGDQKSCRLLETYANAEAALAHCTGPVVRELVPKLLESASVASFEVYGDPGPQVSAMLAGFGAAFFEYKVGLASK
jgi:quinol monooxygenase YgiN